MNVEFVDSNVLVYAFGAELTGKQHMASALLGHLSRERNGALSIQVLSEFCNVILHKHPDEDRAGFVVDQFRTWSVHSPSTDDVLKAGFLHRRFQLSFWDAMIVNSALQSNARILWTEDLQDGQRFGDLVVRNPFRSGAAH